MSCLRSGKQVFCQEGCLYLCFVQYFTSHLNFWLLNWNRYWSVVWEINVGHSFVVSFYSQGKSTSYSRTKLCGRLDVIGRILLCIFQVTVREVTTIHLNVMLNPEFISIQVGYRHCNFQSVLINRISMFWQTWYCSLVWLFKGKIGWKHFKSHNPWRVIMSVDTLVLCVYLTVVIQEWKRL